MKKFLLKSEAGFTLIELMVVVAIIGVLSAIAVPNFKKYQAKAKQSEAKIQLAAVYSVEVGSMADYDAYATCLDTLGYDVTPRGYYRVGFSAGENTAVVARNSACLATTFSWAPSVQPLKAGGVVPTTIATATNKINSTAATAFVAGADGNISAALTDMWTINELKSLLNASVGY